MFSGKGNQKGPDPIKDALDDLLLASRVRELSCYTEPVSRKDVVRRKRLYRALVGLFYGRRSRFAIVFVLSLGFEFMLALLLRLLLDWRKTFKDPYAIFKYLIYKLSARNKAASEITTFVLSAQKENVFIRNCLLLWNMNRYGLCIEFLIKRYYTDLLKDQTASWLSHFLYEIGETAISDKIAGRGYPLKIEARSKGAAKASPIKYGLVLPTMFNSEIFQSSLISLIQSDYTGDIIVVEEGNQEERTCEDFCRRAGIKYAKQSGYNGTNECYNRGIKELDPSTDVIIVTHSDVLWPARWFADLDGAWSKIFSSNRVGIINLGYQQFNGRRNSVLRELFKRNNYTDLLWTLESLEEMPNLSIEFKNIQNRDRRLMFGLAEDAWNESVPRLEFMTGRFSVSASFPKKIWDKLGGFEKESYSVDLELQEYCFENKMFCLWLNNAPLIHCCSSDSLTLKNKDEKRFWGLVENTYKKFQDKHGYDLEHFLSTYFAEISVLYHDEIISAANELRFSDADFIFDEFNKKLKEKKCDDCEIYWCKYRKPRSFK